MPETVAEMRKRIEAQNAKPLLSPAQIADRDRKNNSSRKRAIRVAKARASRYNMTLRSMTIQSAMKMQQIREEDMQSIKDVKAKASKYNATSRAIGVAVPRKHFDNLGHALDRDANPEHAKRLVEAVAEHVAGAEVDDPEDYIQEEEPHTLSTDDKIEIAEAPRRRKSTKSVRSTKRSSIRSSIDAVRHSLGRALPSHKSNKSMASEVHSDSGDTVTEVEQGQRSRSSSGDSSTNGFYMTSLATAIQKGDEDEVNKAILKEFLEEHDPSRLDEVDELLMEYRGMEADLFTALTEEYPDPSEETFDDGAEGGGSFIGTKETFADYGNMRGRQLGEVAVAVVTDMENRAAAEAEAEVAQEASKTNKKKTKKKSKSQQSTVEAHQAQQEEASAKEAARAGALTDEERKVEHDKSKAEKEHARKKDDMLKQQLNVYGKGTTAMVNNNNGKKKKGTASSTSSSKRGSKTSAAQQQQRSSSRVSVKSSSRSSTNSLVSTTSEPVEEPQTKRSSVVAAPDKAKKQHKKRQSSKGVTMAPSAKTEDAGGDGGHKRMHARKMSSKKSLGETGFILSGIQTNSQSDAEGPKWAVNVQARVLKERMMKAGVSESAIAEITGEDSGML